MDSPNEIKINSKLIEDLILKSLERSISGDVQQSNLKMN